MAELTPVSPVLLATTSSRGADDGTADLNEVTLLSSTSGPNGRMIVLDGNFQTIHVAINSSKQWDVVTLILNNNSSSSHNAEITWAGTVIGVAVSARGFVVAFDRWRLNSGLEITARQITGSLGEISIYCHVDRYPAG